jgi:thymidylate synthase
MKEYIELVKYVLDNGQLSHNRTGVDTLSVFGYQCRYDLDPGYPHEGFPILTTKKMFWKGIVHELLWYLKGDCNLKYLQKNGVNIWNEWANKDNVVVNCYPKQWRKWEAPTGPFVVDHSGSIIAKQIDEIDQIVRLVSRIKIVKENPSSPYARRLIISAWNPADEDEASLPWCQSLVQFNVDTTCNGLSCQLYQRSADLALGVPFNLSSYTLFTYMIAHVCGLTPMKLIHTFGNAHIYVDHVEGLKRQLQRIPGKRPTLWLNPEIKNIDDFKYEDIKLINYVAEPNDFNFKVAV